MAYKERKELYKKIENKRNRPLICYVTSHRINASAQMGADVIPEFARHILKISKTNKEIDLLIVSMGGDPIVSLRIVSMVREKFKKFGVITPFSAYSAATLVALGADEIVMHPFSNLGPVDPQIVKKIKETKEDKERIVVFSAEDLNHYLEFVKSDVGITDQEQLEKAFELICKDVGAILLSIAKRSSHLSQSLGEKLLSMHMKEEKNVKAITEALNKSFYYHGYAVGRKEAKKIGLPVTYPDEELEELLWEVWQDVSDEMKCNKPFIPLEVVLENEGAKELISPIEQVQMPTNLQPAVMQQIIQNILKQIRVVHINPVDYELFQSTLESINCKSDYRTSGKIFARRMPDLSFSCNTLPILKGWKKIV